MLTKRACVLCAAIAIAVMAGGCASGFTREYYDTIYEGQPADAVRRTLGEPDEQAGDVWIYVNERPHYYRAEIRFENGKVAEKRWSDARARTPE